MNEGPKIKRSAFLDIHSPLYLKSESSQYCGGDIGDMYQLIDLARRVGFSGIQMTPIQDTVYNNCPYMGESIFSYNPVHISVERAGLEKYIPRIERSLRNRVRISDDHTLVDYRDLYNFKRQLLRYGFEDSASGTKVDFDSVDKNVLAYAVYSALRDNFQSSNWVKWPEKYRKARLEQIIEEDLDLHEEISFYLYMQRLMEQQWRQLSQYAQHNNISIVMDKPIYPSHRSSEVWYHQQLFYLNSDGTLKYVSGCKSPKDPYGEQRWGHAVYRFAEQPSLVVDYFLDSVEFLSKVSGVVRLDHTLGLIWKYYLIDDASGEGKHLPAIKEKLFVPLLKRFPEIIFIAEDMGYVNEEEIDKPLHELGIPGMRSIQGDKPRFYEVANYPELCVSFTSGHDSKSLVDWWSKLGEEKKEKYFMQRSDMREMNFDDQIWTLVEMAFNVKSVIASVALRDITHDPRRFNLPGSQNETNWRLRMPEKLELAEWSKMEQIIKASGRN